MLNDTCKNVLIYTTFNVTCSYEVICMDFSVSCTAVILIKSYLQNKYIKIADYICSFWNINAYEYCNYSWTLCQTVNAHKNIHFFMVISDKC